MGLMLFFIWIIYALLEGYREAYYWHCRIRTGGNAIFPNLHKYFFLQRIIVGFVICLCRFETLFDFGFYLIALGLIFSFIHNGIYYTTRNKILPGLYQKKWFDQSLTSTAFLTKIMTPINRTIFFVVGSIMFLLTN